MVQTTPIPVSGEFAPLGAMAFLAALAYPEEKDIPKRERFILMAKRLWGWDVVPKKIRRNVIKPEYQKNDNNKNSIENTLKLAEKRIVIRRLPAAGVFRSLMPEIIIEPEARSWTVDDVPEKHLKHSP